MGVCGNRTERPARPRCRRRGKWPDRARRFLFKMVSPGRMVTPGTGLILKTTRRFQVRLPFLPQAKRRGRVKPYLYVGLIESDVREFCPGFPGDYPGIHHRYSSLYPDTGDGHRHKMQGVPARRKCGRKSARKYRSEKWRGLCWWPHGIQAGTH